MNYQQFKQHLTKDSPSSLYLIHGEESYLVNKAVSLLKSKVLGEQVSDLTFIPLNGEATMAREIMTAADSMPLLGGQKLVLVKNAQALKAKEQEALIDYFSRPASFNVLVFAIEGKIDQRKKFFTTIKKQGQVVACPHPKPRDCLVWLKQQAKACDCDLAHDAANHLLEASGADLQLLDNELNKIITFVGEKKRISLSDVEAVLGRRPSYPMFQLTDAIRKKNLKTALQILNQLLSEGHHPLLLLAMLANQLRKIARAKELLNQGVSTSQIGQQVGILPFLRDDFVKQAGNFNLEQIRQALSSLLATDIKLKSSSQPANILMEALLIELCPS